MRLLIAGPVYPPYRGGMAVIPYDEYQVFTKRGHGVRVLTLPYAERTAQEYPEVMPSRALMYGNGGVVWRAVMAPRGFDAVHLHLPFFGSDLLLALACKMWRVPLVVTFHHVAKAPGVLGLVIRLLRATTERLSIALADEVFVSSAEYAEVNGIHHRNLRVMPFAVNTSLFCPADKVVARTHFGLPADAPTLVFVGGMDTAHAFKGIDILLRALRDLPNIHLLLVGDGDRRASYEALARELGVADRAHFLGRASDEVKAKAYQAADIHVLPSVTKAEAFGIVTLEALATGIPSIVTDLPGVRTLTHGGETGVVVPVGDVNALRVAVDGLLHDTPHRLAMGARARALALTRYDADVLTEELVARFHAVTTSV